MGRKTSPGRNEKCPPIKFSKGTTAPLFEIWADKVIPFQTHNQWMSDNCSKLITMIELDRGGGECGRGRTGIIISEAELKEAMGFDEDEEEEEDD